MIQSANRAANYRRKIKNPTPVKETALEKKLVDTVEAVGGLCWKFVSPGTTGVPDRICVFPHGKIIFVEMKLEFGIIAGIQRYRNEQLADRYCDARVVKGEGALRAIIKEIRSKYPAQKNMVVIDEWAGIEKELNEHPDCIMPNL